MPLYNNPLGKYLHKLRFINNETQKEMAKRLGITATMLTYIEQGKRKLSDKLFKRLAKEYDLTWFKIDKFNELRKGKRNAE